MDKDEEMTIRIASSRYFSFMQKRIPGLREEDKVRLRDAVKDFNGLEEYDTDKILSKLTNEPFYTEISRKILSTDFSENSELLANSLIVFIETMEEIFWFISESTASWDTPAGKPDPEDCYDALVPTLKELDGNLYLDGDYKFYDSVLNKLSATFHDGDLLRKTAIYRELNTLSLLNHSKRTVESLNRETVIEVFEENFERATNRDETRKVLFRLKLFIDSNFFEDFGIKDLIFAFLNEKDAEVIRSLFGLKPYLKFGVYNPSKDVSFYECDVVFNCSKQVVGLQLRNMDLEKFFPHILQLEHLRALNLSNINLRKLPETIGNLKRLEELSFSNRNVYYLIRGAHYRRNLMNANSIQNLPKSITNLKKLKKLDLSENLIREIKGLDDLTSLQELSICGCQITEIKNLDSLVNLTCLKLDDNQITEIKGLEKLTNLENLDLGFNQITEINGLETLTRLNSLNLRHNRITEVKGLETLTDLAWFSLLNNPGIEQSEVIRKLNIVNFERKSGNIKSHWFEYEDTQKLVNYCRNAQIYEK